MSVAVADAPSLATARARRPMALWEKAALAVWIALWVVAILSLVQARVPLPFTIPTEVGFVALLFAGFEWFIVGIAIAIVAPMVAMVMEGVQAFRESRNVGSRVAVVIATVGFLVFWIVLWGVLPLDSCGRYLPTR